MKAYATDRIRNVALVGHGGTGKTTLVEALLAEAGVLTRPGRVEDGTTTSDYEPEEHKRRISLGLSVCPLEWREHKINLIDTPGYADFGGDAEAALRVADLAVLVVSAVEGVEVRSEWAWRTCERLEVPRMVFINKLDRERADFGRTMGQLRDRFGQRTVLANLELPIGAEAAFHGVADLLTDRAYTYDGGWQGQPGPVPEELAAAEHEGHDTLVEAVVVGDDEQLERYLGGDEPSVEELERTLASEVAAGSVVPVLCGSALTGAGLDRLVDFLVEIGPSPAVRPATVHAGDTTVAIDADPTAKPLAYVFKTIADPYVGYLSLFRVLSGTIRVDDHLVNSRSGADERLHGLFHLCGSRQEPVAEVRAGDLAAVAKLTGTRTGDTLAPKGTPVVVAAEPAPPPALALAIKARTQADDDKLGGALHKLTDEDQALRVERADETHQTLLKGTGETHLQVALERLERKFGVKVDVEDVKVPYRETVNAKAEAEGKYKKQSGGHGQFGIAWLRVEPRERGAGFEFVDKVVGGAIPRQFIPAVAKGVEEAMASGGPLGHPVVDVRVECFDGKAHPVDSSEMSFKMAGSLGFKEAMAKAGTSVLEPVSLLTVTVPAELQGDVMGDISSRRGRMQGTIVNDAGEQEIAALVPTAEILRYAVDLRSMTGGRGRFVAVHDHYDVVPSHLVAKVSGGRNGGGA